MIRIKKEINDVIAVKNLVGIKANDILKRKIDNCYYEVESIHSITNSTETAYYNFYGFTIKGKENLKFHFENVNNNFEVYTKK